MLMKEFGPLSNYSSLRFERFHQKGKRSVRNSESKINLLFQIAKTHSMKIVSSFNQNEASGLKIKNFSEISSEKLK